MYYGAGLCNRKTMQLHDTLTDLLATARGSDRHIRFIDGESEESVVSFASLWDRAVALLGALQSRGIGAGDELVIFSRSNENFVIAFWAAILGGIVPVPVAVGIEGDMNAPRYAGLSTLMAALRADITQFDLDEIGMTEQEIVSGIKFIGVSPPRPRPKKYFKPDSRLSAVDRLRLIMSGGLAEKNEKSVEGSPEDISREFVRFLHQEKIIRHFAGK